MKILFLDSHFNIDFIPRNNTYTSEILIYKLKNEITNLEIEQRVPYYKNKGIFCFKILPNIDFETLNTYELTVLIGLEVVFLGKITFLEKNTDLQNYTNGSQTTKRFGFI